MKSLLILSIFAHAQAILNDDQLFQLIQKNIPPVKAIAEATKNGHLPGHVEAQNILADYIVGTIPSFEKAVERIRVEAPVIYRTYLPLVTHLKEEIADLKTDEAREYVTTVCTDIKGELKKPFDERKSTNLLEVILRTIAGDFLKLSAPAQQDVKRAFADIFLVIKESKLSL